MMPYLLWTIWIVSLIFISQPVQAQTVGFIDGLWFSNDQPVAEQPVRIYAAIRNQAGTEITGDIEFYIDGNLLDSQAVTALDGRIIEAWTDWVPTLGSYTISARLSNLTAHNKDQTKLSLSSATQVSKQIQVTAPAPAPTTEPVATTSPNASSTNTDYRQGLEQFLKPSRAEAVLREITNWASSTEKKLAKYQSPPTNEASTTIASSTNDTIDSPQNSTSTNKNYNLWNNSKNIILSILRWPLQHPAILQLALLLGSIFLIFRVARYFGRRP